MTFLRRIRTTLGPMAPHVPIISVGGVFDGMDVMERLAAGASLVQAHTAPTLYGHSWVENLLQRLPGFIAAAGYASADNFRTQGR